MGEEGLNISDVILTEGTDSSTSSIPVRSPTGQGETQVLWERRAGGDVHYIVWDPQESIWLLRTLREICKVSADGSEMWTIGKGILDGLGQILLVGDDLVTVDGGEKIKVLSKGGMLKRSITVPYAQSLRGVTYCPERDVFIVTDIHHHCLWFVGKSNGKVVQQIGSKGSGNDQFNAPTCICHALSGDTECKLVVMDSGNNAVKFLNSKGEVLKQVQSMENLQNLFSLTVYAPNPVIFVCDKGHKQIFMSIFSEGDNSELRTLLSTDALKGKTPLCVCVSPNTNNVLVSFEGWRGPIICYKSRIIDELDHY